MILRLRSVLIWPIVIYLRFFAKLALHINKPKVIGITGSAGKSSTRNVIYSILKDYFSVKMLEKGNSETGIPLAILGLSPIDYSFFDWLRLMLLTPFRLFYLKGTQYIIVEMGVDEPNPPKNMGYLLSITKPNIAVFLNVYPVHTQQFGSVEKITKEKVKIITESGCGIGIYNNDNIYVKNEMSKFCYPDKIKLLTFGKAQSNSIYYKNYQIDERGTKFEFEINHQVILINLIGYLLPQPYLEVFSASILIGIELGLSLQQIKKSIENNFNLPKSRSSMLQGINNSLIIDSSYNASAEPTISFLKMVYELKEQTKKPMVFVFGDMRELGGKAREEHEKVLAVIPEIVDYLYCVGSITKEFIFNKIKIRSNKFKAIEWFKNSYLAGEYIKDHLPENSIILIKGSQNGIFLEESIKPILKYKHDINKLCRQEEFWMKKKTKLFSLN